VPKEKRRRKIEKKNLEIKNYKIRGKKNDNEMRLTSRIKKITSVYLCWKLSLSLFSLSLTDVTAVLIIGN
jgi:hypothetical protein